MRVLICYATTEGQTRKIADFVADLVTKSGHEAALFDATAVSELEPSRSEAAILRRLGAYRALPDRARPSHPSVARRAQRHALGLHLGVHGGGERGLARPRRGRRALPEDAAGDRLDADDDAPCRGRHSLQPVRFLQAPGDAAARPADGPRRRPACRSRIHRLGLGPSLRGDLPRHPPGTPG